MTTRFRNMIRVLTMLIILTNMLSACNGTNTRVPISVATESSTPTAFSKKINLNPEILIQGYAIIAGQSNCASLLDGMTDGLVLGIDPESCTAVQEGSSAISLFVDVPEQYLNQVFTLKIAWPINDVRGLRATERGSTAEVELDGKLIWAKSALSPLIDSYYYAARSEPTLITFVPTLAGNHEIKISIPAMMTWDINLIEISATPYPHNLLGFAYSPYRDCQDANTEDQPSILDIASDLDILKQNATAIRTYSSLGPNFQVPKLANDRGIPIYVGAWLDGDYGSDWQEISGIYQIASAYHIEAAIIGNEYHLRHLPEEDDLNYLVSWINEFKTHYPEIPVGTAEIDSLVFDWSPTGVVTIKPEYKPVLDQIDILFIHIYPFWSGMQVDGAAQHTIDRYLAIKSLLNVTYGGTKRLIIGEVGWPDQGSTGTGMSSAQGEQQGNNAIQQPSAFHPEAQRQYLIELLKLAQENQVDLFYFDAFDELWKTEGIDGVGRSWGTSYSDRTSKYNFSSLLLPPEKLPVITQGDVFYSFTESDFTWGAGSYSIYTDWPSEPKVRDEASFGFRPYSLAFMGNEMDISVYQCERHSHSGQTAIRVNYQPDNDIRTEEGNWSGAYWLYPKDNWGLDEQGQDISDAQAISFWARGEKGNEVVEFVTGGICGEYDGFSPPLCPDTIQPKITTGPIQLTDQWEKYILDLIDVDRSNIIGAFGFATSHIYNPDGAVFYLDDIVFTQEAPDTENVYPLPMGSTFPIYTDITALDNHYIPSNFMGDAITDPTHFSLNQAWETDPYSGITSIQIQYRRGDEGWAGVYWTDPEDNWGQRPGGYDLTGAIRLTFWAKSEDPGQQLQILVGGINCSGGYSLPYRDSVCEGLPNLFFTLTAEWKQYTVNLTQVNRDWSQLLGGFGFVITEPGTFYLDDIIYHFEQ